MGLGSGIREPGSGKNLQYSGSRIQGSKRHRIPDPQHCLDDYLLRLTRPGVAWLPSSENEFALVVRLAYKID
jgi:hypothetical protein